MGVTESCAQCFDEDPERLASNMDRANQTPHEMKADGHKRPIPDDEPIIYDPKKTKELFCIAKGDESDKDIVAHGCSITLEYADGKKSEEKEPVSIRPNIEKVCLEVCKKVKVKGKEDKYKLLWKINLYNHISIYG